MSDPVIRTATDLREAFDRAFADPMRGEHEDRERFIALRIGGDAYALRVAEVGGLSSRRRIVPLPSPAPQLLGLAGHRGAIVPVYDLGALIGYRSGTEDTRWIVLSTGRDPVGLSGFILDGYVEVPAASLTGGNGSAPTERRHLRQTMQMNDGPRGVIDVASIVETITKEAAARAGVGR